MAEILAGIKLRWYDDSSLLTDEPRELLEVFLSSIGVTSDVAKDLMEALLMARARDVSLKASELRAAILELRLRRGAKDLEFGLTDRNILVWLDFFQSIGLLDHVSGKYRFAANKRPSEAFKRTQEVVGECVRFSAKAVSKLERAYMIK